MKYRLKQLFYLPIIPIDILFAIIYVLKKIHEDGILEFTFNGIDKKDLEEFKDNHYNIIFQNILSMVAWFLIIMTSIKLIIFK